MPIDNVGWTTRPSPVRNDGQRRQQPKRKQPKSRNQKPDPGKPQGSIDELA